MYSQRSMSLWCPDARRQHDCKGKRLFVIIEGIWCEWKSSMQAVLITQKNYCDIHTFIHTYMHSCIYSDMYTYIHACVLSKYQQCKARE